MSTVVSLERAAAELAALVKRVAAGEEIIIETDAGAAVRLVPAASGERLAGPRSKRPLGLLRGQIRVGDDFDDPLPEDIARVFRREGD